MARILAIDDHPDGLYLLKALLSGNGHEVWTAGNGAEALGIAIEKPLDLIISDILMPQMDGYQLCAAVRGNPKTAKVPFAFYTATYTEKPDEELAYQFGADVFLRKPLEADVLIEKVDQLLKAGHAQGAAPKPSPEKGALKLYNERLVRKLEKKMLDLEAEIARREEAEAEQRRLERQLLQSQKMEVLGQLAGGVAHDFNNLLQVICGNLELAEREVEAGGRPMERLRDARTAGDHAADLVRQLLLFSRRQPLKMSDISLKALFDEFVRMFRRLLRENIALACELPAEDCWLHGDPSQIEQVLMNLCVNARDAMPGGGTLRISIAPISRAEAGLGPEVCGDRFVRIQVSDTGKGIPVELRDQIFQPFFTTKGAGEGSGLGLAMVEAIVRRHGGEARFSSEIDAGSTFEVVLPATAGPSRAPVAAAQAAPAPNGSETVLLAEDDAQVRRLAMMILSRAGYKVVEAADGQAAIDAFQREPQRFDAAVLDYVMPLKSGKDVFIAIHAARPGMPVLFASGYGYDPPDPASFPGARFDMIPKPFTQATLLSSLRSLLDQPAG